MLIHRIADQLATAAEFRDIERNLATSQDATLGIAQSARPLAIAALYARRPRPCVVVVAGEDAAQRMAQALSAYVGLDQVERIPLRADLPWSDKNPDDAAVGARCRALARLKRGEPCLAVASARALLRCVPPVGSDYFMPLSFEIGQEASFEEVPSKLLYLGYTAQGAVDGPGTFHVHGDLVDVWPAQSTGPVRLEFFGDEIDAIRTLVPSTGQTIGQVTDVELFPARELALAPKAIDRCRRKLYQASQDDDELARHMEMLSQGILFPEVDRYLPSLYATTTGPLAHVAPGALMVLAEPRSLFDDATRYYDEVAVLARNAKASLDGLYLKPAEMDFGTQQRLTLVSIMRAGGGATSELRVQQPDVAGGARLVRRLDSLRHMGYATVFAIPDGEARRAMKITLTDEHIPIVESLASSP